MIRTTLAILFASLYLNSFAGWEIVTKYYNSYESIQNARVENVYITTGFMKIVAGDLTTVFNLEKQEIIYINTKNKRFWQGNTTKFNEEIRTELRRKIDEQLQNTDQKNRDNQKQMYEEMLRNTFTDDNSSTDSFKKYTVKNIRVDQTIAGFKTWGYQVFNNAMLVETVWITPALKISQDFDFRNFSTLLQKLVRGAYGSSFENSDQYFKLLDEGYPLKVEMHLEGGQNSISEVTKITKLTLSKSDFNTPQGYTYGTLTDVGVWDAYK